MILILLGLKSLWRERALFLFSTISLAAVLGPLLVLYGFKFGVVSALLDSLRNDPANREIVFRGNYGLQAADLDRLSLLPGVGFVVAAPRTLAARLSLQSPGSRGLIDAAAVPTAPGDPLLPGSIAVAADMDVVLTAGLSERLRVSVGDHVTGRNERNMQNGVEVIVFDLRVVHVLRREAMSGDRAFLSVATLMQLEAFLDGYAVPSMGLGGRPIAERAERFESVRLYASSIEQVPALDHALEALGFNVVSRSREIGGVLALSRNLDTVFGLIAAIGSIGYAISLAAGLAASLAHKRRYLSLIRLMGARSAELLLFPLIQGLSIAGGGFLMAVAVFFAAAWLANRTFTGSVPGGTEVCVLTPAHFAAAGAVTAGVVLLVVVAIGRSLLTVAPIEVLHDE